jgi:hypothetical protein
MSAWSSYRCPSCGKRSVLRLWQLPSITGLSLICQFLFFRFYLGPSNTPWYICILLIFAVYLMLYYSLFTFICRLQPKPD